MGYGSTLIFVSSEYGFKGICQVKASLEMGKIHNNNIGNLINRRRRKSKTLIKLVEKFEKENSFIYGNDGNYTAWMNKHSSVEQEQILDNLHTVSKKVHSNLPCIFWNSDNIRSYSDCYGDLLITVNLKELKQAIIKDQVIHMGEYYGVAYRQFTAALKLIEVFEEKEFWGDIKVIIYGQ